MRSSERLLSIVVVDPGDLVQAMPASLRDRVSSTLARPAHWYDNTRSATHQRCSQLSMCDRSSCLLCEQEKKPVNIDVTVRELQHTRVSCSQPTEVFTYRLTFLCLLSNNGEIGTEEEISNGIQKHLPQS